jgi:hypothetical protein
MKPSVLAIFSHPFADEDAEEEQPRHHARDGSEYDRLIDLHIALAETEVRFWQAHKAEDERAASKAAAEGQKLSKQIAALSGGEDRGDDDGE